MVSPATYYGYDDNQNLIVHGTAEDATNYIDPQKVQVAIEKLRTVFDEQMATISTNLNKIGEDSAQALVVKGAKMTGSISEAAEIIKRLSDSVLGDLDSLVDAATQARDAIQTQKNNEMYNAVASYSGVTQIR